VRFACIATEKACYPVALMCRVLQISRSGYYAWCQRPARKRVARLCGRPACARASAVASAIPPIPDTEWQLKVICWRDNLRCWRPNTNWVTDITSLWTLEGWLYLAVILDLFSRRVIGWSLSERLERKVALEALEMAIKDRRPTSGLLHHSDRGSQPGFKRSSQHSV
jgi:putative transposase